MEYTICQNFRNIKESDNNITINFFHKYTKILYVDDYKFIINNVYNRLAYKTKVILDIYKIQQDLKKYANRINARSLNMFMQYYNNIVKLGCDCNMLNTRLEKIKRLLGDTNKFILGDIKSKVVSNLNSINKKLNTPKVKDVEFYNYISKKSVIIICPSSELNKEYGNFIDSFDIVVRLNRGFDYGVEFNKNLGSNTDIVYFSKTERCKHIVNSDILTKQNIKHICKSNLNVKFDEDQEYTHVIDTQIFNNLNNAVGNPHLGLSVIVDILAHSPSMLYVLGMDFYSTGYCNGYHITDDETASVVIDRAIAHDKNNVHNLNKMKKYIALLYKNYDNLYFDRNCLDIVNVKFNFVDKIFNACINKYSLENSVKIGVNKEVCVATILNDNFVPGFIGLIKSILKFNPSFNYVVKIFQNSNCKISPVYRYILNNVYSNIEFIDVNEDNYSIGAKNLRFKRFMHNYLTLEIFNIKNYKRVVYLDADMLCFGNLDRLFKEKINANIGVFRNTTEVYLKHDPDILDKNNNIYFNGGALVITESMLNTKTYLNILKLASTEKNCPHAEQDILNRYMKRNKIQTEVINSRYNASKRYFPDFKFDKYFRSVVILHYVSSKPWYTKEKWNKLFTSPHDSGYTKLEKLYVNYMWNILN